MIDIAQKTAVLAESLPYMQKFAGKTFVIKYGGNAMVNDELKISVIQDIVLMKCIGINPIVVHGGGPEITSMLAKMGKKSQFVAGLRVTDEETAAVAEMVLAGKINTEIVSLVNQYGGRAVGLNGKDSDLIVAKKTLATVYENGRSQEVDIGFVGDVMKINANIINVLLANNYIPVIAPTGVGLKGETYNINADLVAGKVAEALGAEKLILLTNITGVLDENKNLLTGLSTQEVDRLIETGVIYGGMIPKVGCALDAVKGGVVSAHIVDGRVPHATLLEIFTDHGVGTLITNRAKH